MTLFDGYLRAMTKSSGQALLKPSHQCCVNIIGHLSLRVTGRTVLPQSIRIPMGLFDAKGMSVKLQLRMARLAQKSQHAVELQYARLGQSFLTLIRCVKFTPCSYQQKDDKSCHECNVLLPAAYIIISGVLN